MNKLYTIQLSTKAECQALAGSGCSDLDIIHRSCQNASASVEKRFLHCPRGRPVLVGLGDVNDPCEAL